MSNWEANTFPNRATARTPISIRMHLYSDLFSFDLCQARESLPRILRSESCLLWAHWAAVFVISTVEFFLYIFKSEWQQQIAVITLQHTSNTINAYMSWHAQCLLSACTAKKDSPRYRLCLVTIFGLMISTKPMFKKSKHFSRSQHVEPWPNSHNVRVKQ